VALRAIVGRNRLQGLVSLEIEGNFACMGLDPAQLFDPEIAALAAICAAPGEH
jgi:hypothetical protein